jgi:hypothetical protein
MLSFYTALLTLLPLALAKTDLSGCTSSDTVAYGGASVIWYVPDTGEICEFLDCGGGAGAPITTQPGCPLYSGTASYTPSYLPGYGDADTTVAATVSGHGSTGSGSQKTTTLPESTGSSMATGSTNVAPVVTSAPLSTDVGTKSTISTMASSTNATVATPSASATTLSSDAGLFSARAVGKEVIVMLAAVGGLIVFF